MVTKRKTTKPAKRPKLRRPNVELRRAGNETIRADEVLSVAAFCARLNTTRDGLMEMRKRGLVVRRDGGKNIRILGSDYLDYVATLPKAEIGMGDHSDDN